MDRHHRRTRDRPSYQDALDVPREGGLGDADLVAAWAYRIHFVRLHGAKGTCVCVGGGMWFIFPLSPILVAITNK